MLHDGIAPASRHLDDPVDASDIDGEPSREDACNKQSELGVTQSRHGLFGQRLSGDGILSAPDVHSSRNGKHGQRSHLPSNASHDESISDILHGLVVGRRGDTTSSTLEDERKNVKSNKDVGVPPCLDE